MSVLASFAPGSPSVTGPSRLMPGAAAFFGVVGIEHLFNEARLDKRDWFYGDNAYFDALRGKYFRFTKNGFLPPALTTPPDYARAKGLGLSPSAWRKGGKEVIVVEQSEHFLKLSGAGNAWLARTLALISQSTERPVIIRRWSRDKAKLASSLHHNLKTAHALVTHTSAAANEALLEGVPVFVSGHCAAGIMASGNLTNIETPLYPDGRDIWAAHLANSQWTLDELRAGRAWEVLNES